VNAARSIALAVALLASTGVALGARKDPAPGDATLRFLSAFPRADSLIRPAEAHFARLWQITAGGENAEAYWSPDGGALVLQTTRPGFACDQILLVDSTLGPAGRLISTGEGRTTCAYFLNGEEVLFSSTHVAETACPTPPDRSQGYVWPVYASYDVYARRLADGRLRRLTDTSGYDAEATVSPADGRIVFTSTRDGDLEIYTMDAEGRDVRRLTNELGYDGGPFFSRDGKWICYRANHPADSAAVDYRALLARSLVRPGRMDLWVMRADGTQKRQVTNLPGASFAPYFTPDGRKILFSSNHHNPRGRDFDLFLVNLDGSGLEAVTGNPTFDGFPMFSPDGRYLAFASNRGARVSGETNIFVAEWK
jgi:Tol biopolymer transport system component